MLFLPNVKMPMVKKCKCAAEATLEHLGEEGREFPGAWNALHTSELAASEAFWLMDMGRWRDVMDVATEALRLYGEALRLTLAEQASAADADDGGEGLRDALGRALSFLARVRGVADRLGGEAPEVYALLDEAEDYLRLAEALLGDGGVEAAEAEVSLAEGLLEEAVGLLRGVDSDRKAERVLEFLEKTEERL